MTELSEKILKDYQVRKSKKQKLAFIELLKQYFPELKIQEGGFGFPKNRNIILGDVESAKVVLTAHYDTCAWLPFPNLITPKNILFYFLYSIAIAIPIIIIGCLLTFIPLLFIKDPIFFYIFYIVFYLVVIYLLLAGPANKHTANDNTSGVITLCEIYQSLTQQQRAQTAFVFFDNEELGLLGSSHFRNVYKKQMKEKLLINYDCVSDGDYFIIGVSKKARPQYWEKICTTFTSEENKTILIEKAEKLVYPSDQSNFKCTVAIAALNKHKIIGYYMTKIHTAKDTIFDENNIRILKNQTISFIDKL